MLGLFWVALQLCLGWRQHHQATHAGRACKHMSNAQGACWRRFLWMLGPPNTTTSQGPLGHHWEGTTPPSLPITLFTLLPSPLTSSCFSATEGNVTLQPGTDWRFLAQTGLGLFRQLFHAALATSMQAGTHWLTHTHSCSALFRAWPRELKN